MYCPVKYNHDHLWDVVMLYISHSYHFKQTAVKQIADLIKKANIIHFYTRTHKTPQNILILKQKIYNCTCPYAHKSRKYKIVKNNALMQSGERQHGWHLTHKRSRFYAILIYAISRLCAILIYY